MIVRNRLSGKNSYSTIPPILILRMHTPDARERGETAELSLLVLPWESCASFRGNRAIRNGSSLNPNAGFLTREALNYEFAGNR